MKCFRFPWSSLVTALSIFNHKFKKITFLEGINKTKKLPPVSNHKLSKNAFVEKIHSVVHDSRS
jgi:hypothetical protein